MLWLEVGTYLCIVICSIPKVQLCRCTVQEDVDSDSLHTLVVYLQPSLRKIGVARFAKPIVISRFTREKPRLLQQTPQKKFNSGWQWRTFSTARLKQERDMKSSVLDP